MDESKQKYFNEALCNFTIDFAAGGAIKSMATKGYTVEQIHSKLDYPVSREQIGQIVWNHFVSTGVILLKDPTASKEEFAVTYESVQDSLGRSSFRQVKRRITYSDEYVLCDFGKRLYQDKDRFIRQLSSLPKSDVDYVLGLPWPLENVWHKKDERIERIIDVEAGKDI